ncbi:MAG: hypothetical protein EB150_07825 [Nitrososphaeria archaeon]|nr:hypothetical protein [Nitrososphaerota archaeon]NDB92363.1 hypothetical protein [Nitrososphaeria archaeon]NDF30089.1 hypothetical protein [Nitrososphaeria archaeon]
MDGLFLGPKRTYEDFKKQIPVSVLPLFDSLRKHCLSLGANVVEDVRAHRIVFGKSLSFRWFADLEPAEDSIIIKIQKDRKEPFQTIIIKSEQGLDAITKSISDAYSIIH